MMTQTHTLVAACLFARPERPARQNLAILIGSFLPDAAIYILFIWSKFAQIPENQLWRDLYFSEPMLIFTAIGNSFPLYFVILLIAIMWAKRKTTEEDYGKLALGSTLGLLALAAMTHLAGDLPVHAKDAHPHFWPLTGWRFHSPVSYWDKNHYGGIFSLIEAALGVVLSIIIFRRFKQWWVRLLAVLALFTYVAVPAYFQMMMG